MRWLSTEACRAPTGTTAGVSGNGHGRGQFRARATHGARMGRVSGHGQNSGADLKTKVRARTGGRGRWARTAGRTLETTATFCDHLHQICKL
jgi:hypothetical protein